MRVELARQYQPAEVENKWRAYWEEKGFFQSDPDPRRPAFCIVIPPPNVTGALHLGHAINNTLQDVLVRWKRMQGYNALWVPGTDHAGIATQAVVERLIYQQEGKTRHDLGREELVRRIWAWKDKYEARILGQLRQLGCSCDWRRTRFTLDPICSRAVRHTFFRLFQAGLIYRGKRLVNWDTTLQTAVADDEVFHETVKGHFWTFRYPVVGSDEHIAFSTTRPETMLGDTAVAVHPDDPRYRHLIGRRVRIPLVERDIPIIADAILVDPALGTGAVKVTPAHDPNDYQCALRHGLPMINILNPDGTINAHGGRYAGLDRYEARRRVVEDMAALGLLDRVEDRDIDLAHSDRSKTPIEPYLSDQWFVRMADLAQKAMDAVEQGHIRFYPERYARTYLDWLREKRDWCISRQLWWGHRIPVWYARTEAETLRRRFGQRSDIAWTYDETSDQWLICSLDDSFTAAAEDVPLVQDPDVLDTWFSSALWPHEVFGWPDRTADLGYYYPTSVLVTSRDIITLWVARMVMMGLFNCGQIPFRHVYIHTKILDGFGETMSKSKGNGVDPLDIIEIYGTDALRFTLVHMATETQDARMPVSHVCPHCSHLVPQKQEHLNMRTRRIVCPHCKQPFRPGGPWPEEDPELPTARLASEKFELGRNFANKLWNAARFLLLNLDDYAPVPLDHSTLPVEDRWILSRLTYAIDQTTHLLDTYQLSEAARVLYDFTWSEFCDWYIEMAKARLRDPQSRVLAQNILVAVLEAIVKLLHPLMPFVTESIWQALAQAAPQRGVPKPRSAPESVTIAPWPSFPQSYRDPTIEANIQLMQDLVRSIRSIRNDFRIDDRQSVDIYVRTDNESAQSLEALSSYIGLLAKTAKQSFGPQVPRPRQAATAVHNRFELYVDLADLIDIPAELKRLSKQKLEKEKLLQSVRARLSNPDFVHKAPPDVVTQFRNQEKDLEQQLELLRANIAQLSQM